MKIAISTPNLPAGSDIFTTTGSELRWALNWIYLLREQGHYVVAVHDQFRSEEIFDLYLHTTRHADVSCNSGKVISKRHAHLAFGLPHREYVDSFACHSRSPGALVFPNQETMAVSEPSVKKYSYVRFLLPTPYPDSILPHQKEKGVNRREITWLLKRVWAHRPINNHERALDSYIDLATWTLEAIRDLSLKQDLIFNYAKENFYGWGMEPMPSHVEAILSSIRGLNCVDNLQFSDVLNFMSKSKLSISIAGLTGSALESVFCGCIPLGYNNPITENEHFLIPTTLTYIATERGLTLPEVDKTSKKDIQLLLEELWMNKDKYQAAQDAYLEAFKIHTQTHCLKLFDEMVDIIFSE